MDPTRSLSRQEAMTVLSLEETGQRQVTLRDIAELTGASYSAAAKIAVRLVEKGWLERLKNGSYILVPASYGPHKTGENNVLAMASAIYQPSYIGWWAAASYRGFTTQKPLTIHVAIRGRARPRMILDTEVYFVAVPERKFFGFQTETYFGQSISMSGPEKTLVDCVDRPDLSGGYAEVAHITARAAKNLEHHDIADTAFKMGSTSLVQRLGFLFDAVGHPFQGEVRRDMRGAVGHQRVIFGRQEERDGDIGYVAEWGVQANISESSLHGDMHRMGSYKPRTPGM